MDTGNISYAMQQLSLVDEQLATAFKQFGPPEPRTGAQGFEAFLSAIVSQQLSTKAAATILARVNALLGEVTPAAVMAVSADELRNAGLSWRKVEYLQGLATAVIDGEFDIAGLKTLSDDDAIEQITQLRGFGRWSAEIYLLFSLQRQDIFPADDLGVLVALAKLKGLDKKPTPKQARELVAHWRPWRSVGTLFLWHYYHFIDNQNIKSESIKN